MAPLATAVGRPQNQPEEDAALHGRFSTVLKHSQPGRKSKCINNLAPLGRAALDDTRRANRRKVVVYDTLDAEAFQEKLMDQPIWFPRATEIQVGSPEIGDRVKLHFDQTFRYMTMIEVTGINSVGFNGKVLSIFDRDSNTEILEGRILSLVGAAVVFGQPEIIATLRRPIA